MINQDFVITSLQPWDIEIGSTIKNTALEISKNNRVLYINTPLDISTWLRKNKSKDAVTQHKLDVINKQKPYIRQINQNLWIADCPFMVLSINQLPTTYIFDFFNKLNNKKIAKHIINVTNKLGFKNYVHLIDTDIYRSQYLKEFIKPYISIYYCRDFVIGESYWKKNGARLEPLIAQKADIVLANSTNFAARFEKYNPHTYPIETGVNLDLYDASKDWPQPEDMKNISHPIIGYIGTLNSTRLDCELLLELAQQCPEYSFVFTGPEDSAFSTNKLHSLKNVFFLGKKPVSCLPGYINCYDVCINPQMVNEITDGNYPLKIDEYLAMGKPTVATSTHTMRDIFSEYTFLATNVNEYKEALKKAILEKDDLTKKTARIQFAQTHSWGHSVNKIYNIIKQYQKSK